MDSPTNTLMTLLRERVHALCAEGNLDEALHAATAAVEKSQQTLSQDFGTIDAFASALEVRADLLRQMGMLGEARDDYKQAIDQLDNRPDRFDQLGRLCAGLGAANDAAGKTERAVELWEQAMQYFEKADPPLLLDVAAMANNIAFLKKAEGNMDVAESHFLKALEILHTVLGPDHEETAAVSNNLGALYHAAGYHEQAREMHMMALEARRKTLGDNHPDTAQSHNNLALAMLETGDRAWARRHFEKALLAFEQLGPECAADLDATASNYCEFLRSEGEEQLAALIEGRVQAVLGTFEVSA